MVVLSIAMEIFQNDSHDVFPVLALLWIVVKIRTMVSKVIKGYTGLIDRTIDLVPLMDSHLDSLDMTHSWERRLVYR